MSQSTSRSRATVSREVCYIESMNDENRITYEETSGNIIMKAPTTETGYNQYFVKDPIPGGNKFKLYVYDYDTSPEGDAVEGTKFFDFNPQTPGAAPLRLDTELSAGRSQMWDVQKWKSKKCSGTLLIESEGRYIKNNGMIPPPSAQ